MLDAATIVGLLAEPDRRRVVAALVLGATTIAEIRAATGLDHRAAATALTRLTAGELVIDDRKGNYHLLEEAFRMAARAAAPTTTPDQAMAAGIDATDEAAKVLRTFVREGRLVSIPAQYSKRLVILDLLAQEFEPGRRYREREVNAVLRRWHDDVAALRRYLVDDEFLDRDHGEYWRIGGSVDSQPDP